VAAHQAPVYDRIGGQYRRGRQEDPRIAAALWAALARTAPAHEPISARAVETVVT